MATILTAPAAANPGGTATLTWSGIVAPAPTPGDWIGLYAPGDPDAGPIREWVYASPTVAGAVGSRARPGAGAAAGTCIFPVPADTAAAPMPPGTYEFRLFSNDSFTRLAVSGAITLQAATISGSPSAVIPGQSLSVSFGGLDSPTPGDWFTMFVPGADDHNYSLPWFYVGTGTKTKPAAGAAAGSVPYVIPTGPPPDAGTYELRLFARDGFSKLATSPPITISIPSATISVSGSTFVRGTSIPVSWAIPIDPTPTDWIGMYPVGASDDATLISPFNSTWVYANNGRQAVVPTTANTSGLVNCALATGTPANQSYELRLFKQGSYTLLARSSPFTVTAAPPFKLWSPTSPWNTPATGYAVDPHSADYMANLGYVMGLDVHPGNALGSGGGPQNLWINGANKYYDASEMPCYSVPMYFWSTGAPLVNVAARKMPGSSNPWWSGFTGVPMPSGVRPDQGYGGYDSPGGTHYPGYQSLSPIPPYPFPTPPSSPPPGGWPQYETGDHTLVVIDQAGKKVWEFWNLGYNVVDWTGATIPGWSAGGGSEWPMDGDGYSDRIAGISSRAYGGAAAGGLILKSDMDAGVISHALALAYSFTLGPSWAHGQASGGPVCIGSHSDGYAANPYAKNNSPGSGVGVGWSIPEGARIRLKASVDVNARAAAWQAAKGNDSRRGNAARMLGNALKTYGMYVLDHSGVLWSLSQSAVWAAPGLPIGASSGTVVDGSHLPTSNFTIDSGSEVMKVASRVANALSGITRAQNATVQVAHAAGEVLSSNALPTATLYAQHPYSLGTAQSWGQQLLNDDARAFGGADFEVLLLP